MAQKNIQMSEKTLVGFDELFPITKVENVVAPSGRSLLTVASQTYDGMMSLADKKKLDGVAAGANNYVLPANLPSTIITQTATARFVTDAEKATWNGKANASDTYTKAQVDGRIEGVIGAAPTALDTLVEIATALGNDANFAGTMTTQLSNKVDKVAGKELSTNDFTTAEKNKLTGIATGANNYVHPVNHPASVITQDINNRFVTDAEKAAWNGKAPGTHTHAWGDVTGKPTTFTPAAHTHAYSSLTGLPTIPTNTNELTNGAGFITASQVNGGTKIIVSPTEPTTLMAGGMWFKEV